MKWSKKISALLVALVLCSQLVGAAATENPFGRLMQFFHKKTQQIKRLASPEKDAAALAWLSKLRNELQTTFDADAAAWKARGWAGFISLKGADAVAQNLNKLSSELSSIDLTTLYNEEEGFVSPTEKLSKWNNDFEHVREQMLSHAKDTIESLLARFTTPSDEEVGKITAYRTFIGEKTQEKISEFDRLANLRNEILKLRVARFLKLVEASNFDSGIKASLKRTAKSIVDTKKDVDFNAVIEFELSYAKAQLKTLVDTFTHKLAQEKTLAPEQKRPLANKADLLRRTINKATSQLDCRQLYTQLQAIDSELERMISEVRSPKGDFLNTVRGFLNRFRSDSPTGRSPMSSPQPQQMH